MLRGIRLSIDEKSAAPLPTGPKAAATGAGRGVLYIAFAKFYFMFAGLVDAGPAAGDPVARRVGQLQLVVNIARSPSTTCS